MWPKGSVLVGGISCLHFTQNAEKEQFANIEATCDSMGQYTLKYYVCFGVLWSIRTSMKISQHSSYTYPISHL